MKIIALEDVAEIVQGGRHGLSGNHFVSRGHPAYGAGGLNGYLETFEFEEQAVILSSIGARCGKCFLASGKWTSLANTQVIRPNPKLADARFLWHQLNDESRWPRSGTGQPFIKPSDVKSHLIKLPSLSEQQRIAKLLEQADSLRRTRRYALELSDTFLPAAFLELFGDPAKKPQWPLVSFGELIAPGPQNGLYKPATDYGSGTPIVRIDAYQSGEVVDFNELKRVRLSPEDVEIFGLAAGDFLINRVNSRSHLGKSTLVPKLSEPTVFESNMMRFRVNESVLVPTYALKFLQTRFLNAQIQKQAKDASNQSSINQDDVEGFAILLPPLPLQQKFAALVERHERLRATQREALRQAEHLFQTLLHRAFDQEP